MNLPAAAELALALDPHQFEPLLAVLRSHPPVAMRGFMLQAEARRAYRGAREQGLDPLEADRIAARQVGRSRRTVTRRWRTPDWEPGHLR